MNDEARTLWNRSVRALAVAQAVVELDPNSSVSRAYYSAFHAVSAHFALIGQSFSKHSALEAAIHRDLVKSGVWSTQLGKTYSTLRELRATSDYGAMDDLSPDGARRAVAGALEILSAVHRLHPDEFEQPKPAA